MELWLLIGGLLLLCAGAGHAALYGIQTPVRASQPPPSDDVERQELEVTQHLAMQEQPCLKSEEDTPTALQQRVDAFWND